ncbi:flagellar motor protein MotB [Colwellia sp. PAMC 20917]|uniref:OmpA family protein n=1 Tax=Colwellia sp. PAMC 20917 TaxID=1816218 RepID=UPI000878002C|nr:OmpA family protein [Colwellia sp. PAMC 20917]AOW78821.1 flagellar motor protein MotB [Colwellia sp. PAMC 20917]
MNKLSIKPIEVKTKYLVVAFAVLFISACADTSVVTLEDSVQQLYDLTDYDSDGVVKAREKCDGTSIGAAIDNYGCGTQTSKIMPFKIDVKFVNNSYQLSDQANVDISKLAELLKMNPQINVVIEGHSSKVGVAKLNQLLSNNRAKAVALVLINDFKINEERISSIGYGFERLENLADTEQAHAENRRIMAEISHIEKIDDLKWTIYTVNQAN